MAPSLQPSLPINANHGWVLLSFWVPWSSVGRRLHHELQRPSFGEAVQVIHVQVQEAPGLVRALRLPSVPWYAFVYPLAGFLWIRFPDCNFLDGGLLALVLLAVTWLTSGAPTGERTVAPDIAK